jgi:uncharacterized membrane protein YgcG
MEVALVAREAVQDVGGGEEVQGQPPSPSPSPGSVPSPPPQPQQRRQSRARTRGNSAVGQVGRMMRGAARMSLRLAPRRRSLVEKPRKVQEEYDVLVFAVVWVSQLLLPLAVALKFSVLGAKMLRRHVCRRTPHRAVVGAAGAMLNGSGGGNGRDRARKKRRRNLALVAEAGLYALLLFNLLLFTRRRADIEAWQQQKGAAAAATAATAATATGGVLGGVTHTEVFAPVAFYVLIAGLHANARAIVSRADARRGLLFFVFERSAWQALWTAAVEGQEAGKKAVRRRVLEDTGEQAAMLGLASMFLWSPDGATSQGSSARQRAKLLGFLEPLGENSDAADDDAFGATESTPRGCTYSALDFLRELWGLTVGTKRWKRFKSVPVAAAAVHAALPLLMRFFDSTGGGADNADSADSSGGGGGSSGGGGGSGGGSGEHAGAIAYYLTASSCVLAFAQALLVLRVLHKTMMDYCRRWKAMRLLSAILDRDEACEFAMPHLEIAGGSGSSSSSGGSGGCRRCYNNLTGWLSMRDCVLACERHTAVRNQAHISFLLSAVLVICVAAVVDILSRSSQAVQVTQFNLTVSYDTLCMVLYFMQILAYIAQANQQQEAHPALLRLAKLNVVKQRWHLPPPPPPLAAAAGGTAEALGGHGATWARPLSDARALAELGEMDRLLDVVISHLQASDEPCKMFGMRIDEAFRVKLLLVLGAGIVAQLVEHFVGS